MSGLLYAVSTASGYLADGGNSPSDVDPTTGKGPEWGEAAPSGLLVVVLLCVAVYFLVKSMNRNLKKVPDSFATVGAPASAGAPATMGAPASTVAEASVTDSSGGAVPSPSPSSGPISSSVSSSSSAEAAAVQTDTPGPAAGPVASTDPQ